MEASAGMTPAARVRAVVARLTYIPGCRLIGTDTHLHLVRPRPAVESGEVQPFHWRKPWPPVLLAAASDLPDDQLGRDVARWVWRECLLEAAHEVAEWLHLDGRPVVDPHPGGELVANDGVGAARVHVDFLDQPAVTR